MPRSGRAGWSLHEMAVVLVIVGIMAAIAVPRMNRMVAAARVRGAANRVAADLAWTRQMAARTGRRARMVLERSPDCPAPRNGVAGHRYRLVSGPDSVAVRVELRLDGAGLCLSSNVASAVVFTSYGVLQGFGNRTLVVTQPGGPADTLTLSAVGRVLRRY
jgi:prepilin-type N-terminal cleavage/methylation domain-containing protein